MQMSIAMKKEKKISRRHHKGLSWVTFWRNLDLSKIWRAKRISQKYLKEGILGKENNYKVKVEAARTEGLEQRKRGETKGEKVRS